MALSPKELIASGLPTPPPLFEILARNTPHINVVDYFSLPKFQTRDAIEVLLKVLKLGHISLKEIQAIRAIPEIRNKIEDEQWQAAIAAARKKMNEERNN